MPPAKQFSFFIILSEATQVQKAKGQMSHKWDIDLTQIQAKL
jgi:hypothetical protein